MKVVESGELDISCLASGTVPGLVRTLVELRLGEWGLGKVAGDVLLIAGELVANAVRATPDREIRVRFAREVGTVLLAVWDSSAAMPVVRPVVELALDDIAPDARALDDGHDAGTGGWGLPLVQALASKCGVTETRPGKWVWARVAC
ncbi:ATP-binding protein [Actinomadura formosensis]|uniref:ATP-binding protein n=1 Tax=Actinomadura formosensis TaxID=60706 RepID=UPI000A8782D5|nr:ATP-binding protein [Actinomadura formosensis]